MISVLQIEEYDLNHLADTALAMMNQVMVLKSPGGLHVIRVALY